MGANLFSVTRRKTITNDEIVHIPAGYEYLTGRNFRLNPEHPPLVKMWAALPLLLFETQSSVPVEAASQSYAELSQDSALEFWRANFEHFKRISLWTRLPVILLTLVLGALIFIYGRQLFGARAAVLAVALFSLEPTMLAHGRIVHTDMAAALGYLLFVFVLHSYYRAPKFSHVLWFGLATGFALLTKFSLIVLVPIFIGTLLYVAWKAPRWRASRVQLGLGALTSICVVLALINAAYFFQHPKLALPEVETISGSTPAIAGNVFMAIDVFSKIVPTYYLFGIYTVFVHNHLGHPASLLGEYRTMGWWYYFPVAFALKTTIPFLLVSVSALAWAISRAIWAREERYILLLAAITFYVALSMTGHINIGVRHIAPVFPFLFILGGAALDRLLTAERARRYAMPLIVMLFAWLVIDTVRIYPNYLSFTNPLTFGKANWQVLSDSNVEWGEDIGALARYLHSKGETKLLGSLSGGWGTAEMYDLQLLDFAPRDLESASTRYVAIGAGFLNGSAMPPDLKDKAGNVLSEEQRQNYFAKYRSLRPEKIFGNSIYLYRRPE